MLLVLLMEVDCALLAATYMQYSIIKHVCRKCCKYHMQEKFGEFGIQNAICQCFIHQLIPFTISCNYTHSSFTNTLPSNWFGLLAHSPIFSPTKFFPCMVARVHNTNVKGECQTHIDSVKHTE